MGGHAGAGAAKDGEPGIAPLRVAGWGRRSDGAIVTWVVSEGRRGRRWRETIRGGDGTLRSSLLLETGPDRRFAHLELSTVAGLLTLHPEGDGTLHGNIVTSEGIEHVVAVPFAPGTLLDVEGSSIAGAAAAFAATGRPFAPRAAVVVGPDLRPVGSTVFLDILDGGRRRIRADVDAWSDADGLPVLEGGSRWPLELDGSSWMDRGQNGPESPAERESRG